MPKRKNLNGLPHNLINSYFGTLAYYKCGYMADWLANVARHLNINEAILDLLNVTIDPPEFNIRPLLINLAYLKPIIERELKGNGFSPDYIIDAKIRILFLNAENNRQIMHCFTTLKGRDGNIIESGPIVEVAFETSFNPFDENNILPNRNTEVFFREVKLLKYTNRLNKFEK
jgi:hypothetical protein